MQKFLPALVLICGMAHCPLAYAVDDEPDPFRDYKGKEPIPAELKKTYAGFVRSAKGGSLAA